MSACDPKPTRAALDCGGKFLKNGIDGTVCPVASCMTEADGGARAADSSHSAASGTPGPVSMSEIRVKSWVRFFLFSL
jgi:hypothetical protein